MLRLIEYSGGMNKAMKIIVKLGGSVITRKCVSGFPLEYGEIERRADEFIQTDIIKSLVKELYSASLHREFSFILINGAGPFGHNLVHSFLNKKNVDVETIHRSVALLNSKLIEELKNFFPAVSSIHPFETCYYDGKEFKIGKLLRMAQDEVRNGKVVSTYGDVIPARNGRLGDFEVISGDDLAVNIGMGLNVEKIIMVTDVDGVFTKDPKLYDDARLIPRLNPSSTEIEFSSVGVDVTGGMRSKVKKLSFAAQNGIESRIINGLKRGCLIKALLGKDVGTLINYS